MFSASFLANLKVETEVGTLEHHLPFQLNRSKTPPPASASPWALASFVFESSCLKAVQQQSYDIP